MMMCEAIRVVNALVWDDWLGFLTCGLASLGVQKLAVLVKADNVEQMLGKSCKFS